MTNRLKKIYIVALAAILSVCAGFALLLARPASASAEETVKVSLLYGNDFSSCLNVTATKNAETSFSASSIEKRIFVKYGEAEVYGVQYSLNGQSFFETFETFTAKKFTFTEPEQTFYIYVKKDIKLNILDGETLKATYTTAYDTKVSALTLADLKALDGTYKRGYDLTGFETVPNVNSEKTFPEQGIRKINLVYTEHTPIFFIFKDGATILKTINAYSGQTLDDVDLSEINTDKGVGYTFLGWADVNGGLYTKESAFTETTYFYAKYDIKPTSTMTFYKGEQKLYEQKVLKDRSVMLKDYPEVWKAGKAAAEPGELFLGWTVAGLFISKDGLGGVGLVEEDTSFYAVYEKTESFNISFYSGEELLYSGKITKGQNYVIGKSESLSGPVYSDFPEAREQAISKIPDGYTFSGFSITAERDNLLAEFTAQKDIVLFAVYTVGIVAFDKSNIIFKVDNLVILAVELKCNTVFNANDYPEIAKATVKEGYTFLGWKREGDDNLYIDDIPTNKTSVYTAVFESNNAPSGENKGEGKVSFLGLGVSTGGAIVIGIAVYFLFFRRRRR